MASKIRDRIVAAAAEAFAETGFAGTSTKDIAERAYVNETSIFRLFRDKEGLFKAALARSFSGANGDRFLVPLKDEPDFERAAHRSAALLYGSLTVQMVRLEYYAALELPKLVTGPIRDRIDAYVLPLAARIRTEQRAGRARAVSPEGAALALHHIVFRSFTVRNVFSYRSSPSLRALVDAWFTGLKKSK